MITRLGLVSLLLIAIGALLLLKIVPLGEPLRSLSFIVLLTSGGSLALFRTKELISPIFASSQFRLWTLRIMGLVMLLLGLAGLVGLVGSILRLW